MFKKCAVFVFSGTGNTRYVVKLLSDQLNSKGCICSIFDVSDNFIRHNIPSLNEFDLVGFAFPIHSYETPIIIYDLVRKLTISHEKPVFLLKTCADASNSTNGVISKTLISRLKKRKFIVFYDRTIVIASNWLFKREKNLIRDLASVAESKVKHMSDEILQKKARLYPSGFFFHKFVRMIYLMYLVFLKWISKDLYTNHACNLCGACVRICPKNNIKLKDSRIQFEWRCISCMRCLYSCPQDAIQYRIFKPFKLKGGYNLKKILQENGLTEDSSWKDSEEYKTLSHYIRNIDA